jgi:Domain of unknown function (DUF4440)
LPATPIYPDYRLGAEIRPGLISRPYVVVGGVLNSESQNSQRHGRLSMSRSRPIISALLLECVLITASANAQTVADQIRVAEHERLRALVDADVEAAGRLHADDFQLITPLGGTASKAEYLGAIASGDIDYLVWKPGNIEVKLYGDAAVIRYQAELQIKVKALPNAPSGRFWHTDVYENRNGRWQVVWSQATQIR